MEGSRGLPYGRGPHDRSGFLVQTPSTQKLLSLDDTVSGPWFGIYPQILGIQGPDHSSSSNNVNEGIVCTNAQGRYPISVLGQHSEDIQEQYFNQYPAPFVGMVPSSQGLGWSVQGMRESTHGNQAYVGHPYLNSDDQGLPGALCSPYQGLSDSSSGNHIQEESGLPAWTHERIGRPSAPEIGSSGNPETSSRQRGLERFSING